MQNPGIEPVEKGNGSAAGAVAAEWQASAGTAPRAAGFARDSHRGPSKRVVGDLVAVADFLFVVLAAFAAKLTYIAL